MFLGWTIRFYWSFYKNRNYKEEEKYREFSEFEVWLAAYSKNKNIKIEPKLNVYGLAYFYQGSYYNSINTYDKALAVMEKGLALQPTETALVTESGVSLIKLNKLQSALDLYNKLLAADGFVPRLGKAYCKDQEQIEVY